MDIPGASEVSTSLGSCLTIRTTFNGGTRHGTIALESCSNLASDRLVRLVGDPRLEGFHPNQALFLDIEATGLDHGAGTCAFLVGLGYFRGEDFIVEQLFLRNFDEEMALLQLLTDRVEEFPFLVSFNGKSYDLTVLQSRLILHRFYTRGECELKLHPHLDLLHLSRNLYKACWSNTRLQTLERERLGFSRQDDIPGSLVPSMWYHFLRTGEVPPVKAVLDHNLWDVLSMVTLTSAVLRDGSPCSEGSIESQTNLAALLLRRGYPEDALTTLQRHNLAAFSSEIEQRARWINALANKQLGRWDDAVAALTALVASFPADIEGWVTLAMLQEHKLKTPGSAYDSALRAWEISREPAIEKRLRRLERKLSRKKAREADHE